MKTVGKNDEVPLAWKEGRTFRNKKGTYRTDGKNLWSYDLLIGYTGKNGVKYLVMYWDVSVATNEHVAGAQFIRLQDGKWDSTTRTWIHRGKTWRPVTVKPDEKTRTKFNELAFNRGYRMGYHKGRNQKPRYLPESMRGEYERG